jgi:predicted transcriptional regulator
MPSATLKHQQLILLEPEQARLLHELAVELRTPKQVLMREAIDDMLAKHGRKTASWLAARKRGLK